MADEKPTTGFPKSVKYKILKTRHESYMQEFWQRCKALYAGGPALLSNQPLLEKCMPKHNNEEESIYKERLSRAFYIPYPGSIIDKLVAELMSKPLTFGTEASETEDADPELPKYYTDFIKNCSKLGAKPMALNDFARQQIFSALQCKTAWCLVDMPKAPAEGYANRDLQDKAGALNAYVCPIDPECVIDWEEKEDGELKWVLIFDTIQKRDNIDKPRNMVTLRWRYFRETDWAIYEYTYDKTKKSPLNNKDYIPDNEDILKVDEGKHSFGRVPVRRMSLPEGLWAMGKLEAIARAHLNQRNALSWGQLKSLMPVPVLYVQNPDPQAPMSEDAARIQQPHRPGYLRALAEKDKLEYFAPDPTPYTVAREDLNNIRDEMHRVLYAMAQSVDNSGAAMQRSGESKAIDQAAASIILRALGNFVRDHLEDVLFTIAQGRKEDMKFHAHGMDNFDDVTLSALVVDATGIMAVGIPSATFQRLFKYKIAKLALGADVSEDDLEAIEKELATGVTQDEFAAEAEAKVAGHEATVATSEATVEDPQGIKAAKALGKTKPKSKPKSKK